MHVTELSYSTALLVSLFSLIAVISSSFTFGVDNNTRDNHGVGSSGIAWGVLNTEGAASISIDGSQPHRKTSATKISATREIESTNKSSQNKVVSNSKNRSNKFQNGIYDKPIVLIGCRGAGNELNRIAASIVSSSTGVADLTTQKVMGELKECEEKMKPRPTSFDRKDTVIPSVGTDGQDSWVLSYTDLQPMIENKNLNRSNVMVLDFDAPALSVDDGESDKQLISQLSNLAMSLYKEEDMMVIYVNVHPEEGLMSKNGKDRRASLEKEIFREYSDYEVCIKSEGLEDRTEAAELSTSEEIGEDEQFSAWDNIEWQIRRLLARASLPPAIPGSKEPNFNTAHLTMGENSFFMCLSFPDIMDAQPYVEDMLQDVDAMELRVDLLSCRDDHFEVLYSLQKLREMCRNHAIRAPMLPFSGTVVEDTLPVVYTVRTAHQAGTYPDDDEGITKMFELLQMGLRSGVEVLDVESAWDADKTDHLLSQVEDRYTSQILGSHHVVDEEISTEEAVSLFQQCALDGRANGAKVVLSIDDESMDRQALNASNIAILLAEKEGKLPIPHVGLILGEVGQYSRALNSAFTPVTHESLPFAAAPGQLSANELMTIRVLMGLVPKLKYGILGHNIAYSVSPAMQGAAFTATRLPYSYDLIDMESVDEFVNSAFWKDDDFAGCSVTIPHKQSIIPHLDTLTDAAQSIGAVNTVIVEKSLASDQGKILVGDNTDWKGIFNPLCRKLGKSAVSVSVIDHDEKSKKKDVALILGGGGTARAAAYAATKLGLEKVYYNRTPSKVEELADNFGGTVALNLDGIADILNEINGEIRVIISTLPASVEFELPAWIVKSGKDSKDRPIVFDVNYKPYNTKLLLQAENEGFPILRGSEMLWEQGVGQFELWTGRTAPYKIMKDVVLKNCLPQEE